MLSHRLLSSLALFSAFLTGCAQQSLTQNDTPRGPLEPSRSEVVVNAPSQAPVAEEKRSTGARSAAPSRSVVVLKNTPKAPADHADLWDRLRAGYQLEEIDNARVQRELAWFRKHPKYLQRVRQRAEPYLHHIVELCEQRGLPAELALLPVVESAFQPFAYSPGRASGLWQFIPSTGRLYGLKQNWWYDGRRDVVASTDAAFRYLAKLGKDFDGDWLLALASYNAGEGRVMKAVKRNKRQGRPADYWNLKLPRETQGYVPRLLAVAALVKDPEAYGMKLDPIANRPYFAQVETAGQMDLAIAADMAGISIDELYSLNPAFNRWATDPDGPHRLLVPVDKAKSFGAKLAALPPSQRLSWKRHKIRSGETLGGIARKYRLSVATLKRVNKLRNNNIRAGRHLMIPTSAKALASYTLSADGRRQARLSKTKGNKRIYTVQPGDSLWKISRQYKVSHKKLARWNGMSPKDAIRPGQQLVVWSKSSGKSAKAIPAVAQRAPVKQQKLSYKVRKGDSLDRIARRFGVQVADIRRWNRSNLKGKYIHPGQRLTLMVDPTRAL